MAKNLVLGLILAHFGPNSGCQNFFSKIWLCHSLDVMFSYHHVQYQKKLMIQSWENLVTDGQTDKSDLVGRSPTNAETCTKNKYVCFNKAIWLMAIKISLKIKNRSHKYDIIGLDMAKNILDTK